MKIPRTYLPKRLTRKDTLQQRRMLNQSRRAYRQGKYINRKTLKSYPHRTSQHILRAKRMYGVDRIFPNRNLAERTGCSVAALAAIVRKGEGAYYSSGSRPNQTAQSWGLARLASAITGSKAAKVDYHILEKGCGTRSRALALAKKSR